MLNLPGKKLREFLFSGWPGCTNHSCVVTGPKTGMGTNSSCKCVTDAGRTHLNILGQKLQAFVSDHEKQTSGNTTWKFDLLRLVSKYDAGGVLFWSEDDDLEFSVICNDVFFWGCADAEDVTEEDLPALEQAFIDAGNDGVDLYCARKREMRPQGAMYEYIDQSCHHLFDACGPERDPKEPGNTPRPE